MKWPIGVLPAQPEVSELIGRGRASLMAASRSEIPRAVEAFRCAIALDPGYAAAHAALAVAHCAEAELRLAAPDVAYSSARVAALGVVEFALRANANGPPVQLAVLQGGRPSGRSVSASRRRGLTARSGAGPSGRLEGPGECHAAPVHACADFSDILETRISNSAIVKPAGWVVDMRHYIDEDTGDVPEVIPVANDTTPPASVPGLGYGSESSRDSRRSG